MTDEPVMPIPYFHISQTLMGFSGEDLNRVTLHMPGGREFVLCEINEPRTDIDRERWRKLAVSLNALWALRHQQLEFICPKCGMTSYNPNDIKNSYCGNCHEFFDESVTKK